MRCRGFTLIEIMVAIAVLAILLSIGLPAFGSLIDNQRMDSSVNSLLRSINQTRTEATRRNRHITMAPLSGDWSNGWNIFIDANNNGALDAGEIVLHEELPARVHHVHVNSPLASYLRYNAQGESELLNGGFQSGTFSFCPNEAAAKGRQVIINRIGRARLQAAEIPAANCPS